jgi:transposase
MNVKHESLADIPLIIEFCYRLNLQHLIDTHLVAHKNQEGLSNGQLIIGWIAHILTQNNHCKSPVAEWAKKHKMTLQSLFNMETSDIDFEDGRLGRLLKKLSNDTVWHDIESSFYKDSFSILELNTKAPESFKKNTSVESPIIKTIKIDATTAYGHHEVIEEGIMQRGWSKDNRPDLPQLKIMVSVEGNTGFQIASDIVPGNQNDDVLYIPILERTRKIVDSVGCLMCGDCKMAALNIRANIVNNKEFYLTPLPLHKNAKELLKKLVDEVVDGEQQVELIFDVDDKNVTRIIGAGFETTRKQSCLVAGNLIEWDERVLLVKSYDHAKHQLNLFYHSIEKKKKELCKLESKLSSSIKEAEKELLKKIDKIKKDNDLFGLFSFKIDVIGCDREVKRSEKRNGVTRNGSFIVKKFRAKIVDVCENQLVIKQMAQKIGWRLYVTNAEEQYLTYASAYTYFRKTMYVIEIGFHNLKDYININPLYVRKPDQILGMTRLLMLSSKVLTLMTAEIRANMKKEQVILKGLYSGQSARKHSAPTAQSILKYFSRQEISLIGQKIGEIWYWDVTPLSETCQAILKLLKIPEDSYERIKKACTPKKASTMLYESQI